MNSQHPDKQEKRDLEWFLRHIFSTLFLQFGFESKEFWFGKSDPWDKTQKVKFRFFKMYVAVYFGFVTKGAIPLLLSIFSDWLHKDGISIFGIGLFILIPLIAFLGVLEDWYKYWKETRNRTHEN